MSRCIRAFIFSIAGDRLSRKWTFIINIVLYALVGIITGFCQTYVQFFATRALYGIAMGGIYGNSAAIALEDAPIPARGLLSGFLQQGYTLGSLLASARNPLIVNNQAYTWRAVFWLVSILALIVAVCHSFLPETEAFARIKQMREKLRQDDYISTKSIFAILNATSRSTIMSYFLVSIYLILLASGFGFLTHGSQDMYPIFSKEQLNFSDGFASMVLTVAYSFVFIGRVAVGYCSTFFARRLTMIVVLIIGAALIPAYILPQNTTIIIGASLEQVCVEGAYGIVPIHLLELAPLELRSSMIGSVYEIGNLIASSSPTIVAAVAQRFPLSVSTNTTNTMNYDYGKSIGILLASVYAFLIHIIFFSPERRNMDELHDMTVNYREQDRDIDDGAPDTLEHVYLLAKSDPLLN